MAKIVRFHETGGAMGGFLMSYSYGFAPLGFTTANDGTGSAFRVSDIPIFSDNWSLVVLPDNANVDPSVVIGSGSTIDDGVVIDEGVVLGEDVSVDQGTVIGADTTISDGTVLSQNVEIGSGVMIGTDGSAD